MQRKYQTGDEVVHKSDPDNSMTVVRYTENGTVVCRRKDKKGNLELQEFMEEELVQWHPSTFNPADFVFQPKRPPY